MHERRPYVWVTSSAQGSHAIVETRNNRKVNEAVQTPSPRRESPGHLVVDANSWCVAAFFCRAKVPCSPLEGTRYTEVQQYAKFRVMRAVLDPSSMF